ncbi:spore germination protein [Paenibacillus spongiae]|uniref:Spore germination protein n=1 Tax=Paenibacillus spongiae TaxID=2909671 RepID=A0ABY5SI97_9BACL|nr:spore germination protein [Paenibacillus spongiae]UVI33293.1 spore germination protein [Paenibacillus spongiae]
MPSLVGSVNINSNDGVVNFGDTLNISPKTANKAISGQGGGNTGNVVITLNGANINNTSDPDVIDEPILGNA